MNLCRAHVTHLPALSHDLIANTLSRAGEMDSRKLRFHRSSDDQVKERAEMAVFTLLVADCTTASPVQYCMKQYLLVRIMKSRVSVIGHVSR